MHQQFNNPTSTSSVSFRTIKSTRLWLTRREQKSQPVLCLLRAFIWSSLSFPCIRAFASSCAWVFEFSRTEFSFTSFISTSCLNCCVGCCLLAHVPELECLSNRSHWIAQSLAESQSKGSCACSFGNNSIVEYPYNNL